MLRALLVVVTVVPLAVLAAACGPQADGDIARCTCTASRASGNVRVIDRVFETDRCFDAANESVSSVADDAGSECLADLLVDNDIVDDQKCECTCIHVDQGCFLDEG